eukprot:TRINITY_DN40059_c0_g1_i1.p1 TRINITY_DN40059_c0_g1~~TRINITY_DN40059_c0_g1_i1.p1  ORF type:complete len:396 (-),score=25.61 TRINITY_DN40059_c0_g1_i1:202-1332(-)
MGRHSARGRRSKSCEDVSSLGETYQKVGQSRNLTCETGEPIEEFIYRGLPEDTWGVCILEIVTDFSELLSCNLSGAKFMRLSFICLAMAANLYLQLIILYNVDAFIVEQAVHDTQENYAQFHREIFSDDGSFLQDKWKAWKGPYMELCNLPVTNVAFSMAIIFLWTGTMLGEFRSVQRLFRDLQSINALPEGMPASHMVETITNDETCEVEEIRVRYLTSTARFLVYTLIILPKLLIAAILLYIGCRWLVATESFSDLILNALALEFIIGIDEYMLMHFLPERERERLSTAKLLHLRHDTKHNEDAQIISAYFRSYAFLFVAVFWSLYYLWYGQRVLPQFPHDLSGHCDGDWFRMKYTPPCGFWDSSEDCFPYGDS